jgi:hypothetical protein
VRMRVSPACPTRRHVSPRSRDRPRLPASPVDL